jgi:hypothetical protein
LLEQRQLPVEEVAGGRHHRDRQHLRPRPVEHGLQRHHVVGFAVDDHGVLRHRRGTKFPAGATNTSRVALAPSGRRAAACVAT